MCNIRNDVHIFPQAAAQQYEYTMHLYTQNVHALKSFPYKLITDVETDTYERQQKNVIRTKNGESDNVEKREHKTNDKFT